MDLMVQNMILNSMSSGLDMDNGADFLEMHMNTLILISSLKKLFTQIMETSMNTAICISFIYFEVKNQKNSRFIYLKRSRKGSSHFPAVA